MFKRVMQGVMVAGVLALTTEVAVAQVGRDEFDALKSEIGALKEVIKSQTDAVRQLLERMTAPRDAPFHEAGINVDGAAFYGKRDAKVTIVEFSDYQCPFCARYSQETFPQIERDYIQTGRVKYVFRDFPIEAIHPAALKAHEAVHCAAEQSKHREMHEKLFSNQRSMGRADLASYAQSLGLDATKFQKCLDGDLYSAKIRKGVTEGEQSGVRGTPTFFLGLTEPDSSKVKAVRRIIGAQPYNAFKAAIEELLSTQ